MINKRCVRHEIEEPMTLITEEKKRDLCLRQKQLPDTFPEHGVISQAQYNKSLGDLTVKMRIKKIPA